MRDKHEYLASKMRLTPTPTVVSAAAVCSKAVVLLIRYLLLLLFEPVHEISNNVICATSKAAYAQSDQSLCLSLEYSMTVKLLTEHHLEFLHLKGGCTGSTESTHVKMPHYWKSHVTAHLLRGFKFDPCFVMQYLVTFLVFQSFFWGKDGWLLYFNCLPDVFGFGC